MGLIISLIIIGLVLIMAEILIFPGIGFSGILGLLALVGSCLYAWLQISQTAGIIVCSVNVVLVIGLMIFALRSNTWSRLALNTKIDSRAGQDETVVTVGEKGKTLTRLAPMGTAKIKDKILEVKSQEGIIDAGVEIEVVLIDDGKIYVKSIN
jgi:membrane-bound ClpP family serine protease